MAVNLSEEDAQLFIKNGFSREQVGETVNHYRSQGLSDEDIQAKLNARVAGWRTSQQPQPQTPKPTPQPTPQPQTVEKPLTPDYSSGTATLYGNAEYTPTYEEIYQNYKSGKLSKQDMLTQAQRRHDLDYKEADEDYNKAKGKVALGATLEAASMHPFLNVPFVGTGIGGALYETGAGIAAGETPKDIAKRAGQGFIVGETIGAIPYVGKGLAKTKAGQAVIRGTEKFGERVIGALSNSPLGSKILTGTEKLGNILAKKRALPFEKQRPLPPSTEGTPLNLNTIKNNIKSNQFDKKDLQVVKGVKQVTNNGRRGSRIWSNVLENEDNGVIYAEREFNNIIKEMGNNPDKLRNPNYVKDLENRVQKVISDSPYPNEAEFAESFWDRYAKALDEGMKYNEVKFGTTEANYFGGKVEQPSWLDKYAGAETKKSKLPQTMRDRGTLPPEMEGITPEYQVLHNADLSKQATQLIEENPNQVLGQLQQKAFDKNAELSALDFETARQTVSKLYQEGRIDEAMALTEQIAQKASKAGQSVQALSLWSRTTPEGAIRQAQKIIADYNRTAKKKLPPLSEEQAKKIMELSQNAQATELGTRENEIATQLLMKELKNLIPASAGSKLRTLQNISLLLNPKTFLRNIGGNTIFAGMENAVAKPIAAGLDRAASIFTKQRTRVLPQMREYAQGLGKGFREGAEDVRLGINTRDNLGTRFNLNDRTSFDNIPGLNQLEKGLNYSLQVPDRMFYQATYNESIANQLRASGLTEPTTEMINNAANEALEAVYQNKSALGDLALNTRALFNNKFNVNGYGVGDLLLPYAQTPANVALQGFNYSPLGLANAIKNGLAGNQRQATLDAARALTGTGIMGLGAYGSAKGLINPESDNFEIQKNYEALGIKPNTLNIGDYNVSFNQLQPLAAPVLGGAATYQAQLGEGGIKDIIDKSTNSVLDLGMLQNTLNFVNDLSSKGLGTAAINVASGVPSRFIPTGLKQITDLTDNTQRDTADTNPLKQGLNQAIAKIPGANRTLPVKYDVTGQPMQKYQTEGLQRVFDATTNPVFVNRRTNDATVNKLIDLYESTGEKSALLPLADKTVRFKDLQGNQVVRPLNASERNIYQRQLGVINKQLLDNIVNTEFYNNLDDENKINLINTTQRYVKSYVDEELWGKPNAQKRALIRKLTKKDEDKILRKITKIYKDKVLPIKTQQIYEQNFK